MNIAVREAKLNTEKRNELKDSDFGLPKERKFPLNDEPHVRKAIQFFKFCELTKRNELAKNINKKLKEYDMKVTVSSDNPFSKYANPELVTITEAVSPLGYVDESMRDSIDFITRFHISSVHDMLTLEAHCKNIIDENVERNNIKHGYDSFVETINEALKYRYNEFIEFNDESSKLYNLIENAKSELINESDNIDKYQKKFPIVMDIFSRTNNKYHIYRACSEAISVMSVLSDNSDDDTISLPLNKFIRDLEHVKEVCNRELETLHEKRDTIIESMNVFDIPDDWNTLDCIGESFDSEYNDIKNDLYIIESVIDNILPKSIDSKPIIDELDLGILPDRIRCINVDLKHILDECDVMRITRYIKKSPNKYITNIYTSTFMGDTIRYGFNVNTQKQYLIAKLDNSETYSIILLELNQEAIDYITGVTPIDSRPLLHAIRITEKNASITLNKDINKVVSEAFTVNEEGDIKITISPKNSYMDSYSSNHKMLVENWKNKNYDAMKKNLAYVFALIAIIERSDGYKNKDPEVMKARAFAINDFKTYLKHLQSVEPDFDFVEYYRTSDYDKKIVNVPKSTIMGIRNLMRAILI
jgi:hypothetical protein